MMKVRLAKAWFAAPLAYFSAVVAALLLGAIFIVLFTDCLLYTSPSPRDRG